MTPRRGSGPAMRAPSSSTSPALGEMKPATSDSSVDLPQPDGPTMLTNSCGWSEKETSRSASTRSPVRNDTNVFETERTSIFAFTNISGVGIEHAPTGPRHLSRRSRLPPWREAALKASHGEVDAKADHPDHDHVQDERIHVAAHVQRAHHELPQSDGARRAGRHLDAHCELGCNDRAPRERHGDSRSGEDRRQCARQHDGAHDECTTGAKRARRIDEVAVDEPRALRGIDDE